EDARAEQAVPLRLEGAVVDGLGLLDLAERPGGDVVGARDRDANLIEGRRQHLLLLEEVGDLVHRLFLLGTRGGPASHAISRYFPSPRSRGEGRVRGMSGLTALGRPSRASFTLPPPAVAADVPPSPPAAPPRRWSTPRS